MIKELFIDLINKLSTVTDLTDKVGACVGGTEADPTMSEAPVPFAWVVFGGSQPNIEIEGGKKYHITQYNFVVNVIIDYGIAEADFLDTITILEDAHKAVVGTEINGFTGLWECSGVELRDISPKRMTYQLTFYAAGFHKN